MDAIEEQSESEKLGNNQIKKTLGDNIDTVPSVIEDAQELPSDEQLAAAWALVPKTVREAFGYSKEV